MRKKLIILTAAIMTFCMSVVIIPVKADSGWDTSYSGGGGSSSSSWSSSSSSSSSGGGTEIPIEQFALIWHIFLSIFIVPGVFMIGKSKKIPLLNNFIFDLIVFGVLRSVFFIYLTNILGEDLGFITLFLDFIIVWLTVFFGLMKLGDGIKPAEEEPEVIEDKFDVEQLKKITFDIYKQVQEAWMNFDYDKLKSLTSSELYNQYESQLKVLKTKEQQNIMSDIKLDECKIKRAVTNQNKEVVTAKLSISMFDYVIDNTGKVVQGNKNDKVEIEYEIVLTRNIKTLETCPGCGSKIKNQKLSTCEYCGTKLINNNSEFVMNRKKATRQWK